MDKLVVKGPSFLKGEIAAGGSKNCALPVLFATLLSEGPHHLTRVPKLQDMDSTRKLLEHLGTQINSEDSADQGSQWTLRSPHLLQLEAPYDLVRKMRASFLCLGPLLAREGRARVSLPGGCAIGARPVDLHLMALEKMGAEIDQAAGYVETRLPADKKQLHGAHIIFPLVSVGATENTVMAACLADGDTLIENAAQEPEVRDLCRALQSMGAQIEGIGTSRLQIQGKKSLGPMNFEIPPDRIEVATYLVAAQLTGAEIRIKRAQPEDLHGVFFALRETGADVRVEGRDILIRASGEVRPHSINTAPFPGFPTDLQAQWMTLMCIAKGDSIIKETIFENRFMHVPELCRMGANLEISGSSVFVKGQPGCLQGAPVMATDLRASASLVLAGLAARGETHIKRIYHLDRGYECMEKKLQSLGALIERQADD